MTVYLYTGDGAGKTTNGLGLALREMGHGKRVLVIQFLKWNKSTGEYRFQLMNPWIKDHYELRQFGSKEWHDGLSKLGTSDIIQAQEGLLCANEMVNNKHYDLLILDEINLAVSCELLTVESIKLFLSCIPDDLDIVMTGRNASEELMELADVVNEIREIKAPEKFIYKKGVQY